MGTDRTHCSYFLLFKGRYDFSCRDINEVASVCGTSGFSDATDSLWQQSEQLARLRFDTDAQFVVF